MPKYHTPIVNSGDTQASAGVRAMIAIAQAPRFPQIAAGVDVEDTFALSLIIAFVKKKDKMRRKDNEADASRMPSAKPPSDPSNTIEEFAFHSS